MKKNLKIVLVILVVLVAIQCIYAVPRTSREIRIFDKIKSIDMSMSYEQIDNYIKENIDIDTVTQIESTDVTARAIQRYTYKVSSSNVRIDVFATTDKKPVQISVYSNTEKYSTYLASYKLQEKYDINHLNDELGEPFYVGYGNGQYYEIKDSYIIYGYTSYSPFDSDVLNVLLSPFPVFTSKCGLTIYNKDYYTFDGKVIKESIDWTELINKMGW